MSDYIERQKAIEALTNNALIGETESGYTWFYTDEVYSILKTTPSADVAPVRHGTWLPIVSYNNTYKCSECGRLLVNITDGLNMVAKHYPYCHCGAKMDAQREE